MADMEELLKKLSEDEAFTKELSELETADEIVKKLNEAGYQVTYEDLASIQLTASAPKNGELDDDDLDDVNGGFVLNIPISKGIDSLIKMLGKFFGGSKKQDASLFNDAQTLVSGGAEKTNLIHNSTMADTTVNLNYIKKSGSNTKTFC